MQLEPSQPAVQEAQSSDAALDPRLAKILAEVLEIQDCRSEQRLLELGADSVAIIRIANLMEEAFGQRPSLEFLFQNPSLEEICRSTEGAAANA
jgi:acyl carrier protein